MLPVASFAQNTGNAGGRLIRMSDFGIGDMMQFSQYDYTFGTARSAAMGGAFTSLGADLATMAINPAGLGMYRSSEFSISPSLTWTNNSSLTQGRSYEDKYTRFTLGNLGVALNVYQSTGSLTSFTLGFGYTKMADFNYNNIADMSGLDVSINDVFAYQVDGMPYSMIKYESYPERNKAIPTDLWGAIMARQVHAINGDDLYSANLWNEAVTRNMMNNYVRGSLGEYDISGGFNFSNVFYMGMTIGIQSLYYRQDTEYSEWYDQPYDQQSVKLNYLEHDQYVQYNGTGVNFKLGFIVRPTDGLRLGVAVHTPTLMTVDREYRIANTFAELQDGLYQGVDSEFLQSHFRYSSPTRLLAGVSYQFGNVAVLSADYERVWYNGIRLGGGDEIDGETQDMFKSDVKYCFKPADNFRAGMEIKPVPFLALRAGYAYSGSGVRTDKDWVAAVKASPIAVLDNPVQTKSESITLGAGFRHKNFSLDVAYVNTSYDYTTSALYWSYEPAYGVDGRTEASDPIDTSMKRNIVTMTLGVRF